MLNSALDNEQIGSAFAPHKRLRISNFLQADFAEQLHEELRARVPWNLRYRQAGRRVELTATQCAQWGPARLAELARTESGLDFIYHHYAPDAEQSFSIEQQPSLHNMANLLASTAFLQWAQTVTGYAAIGRASMMATCFAPGHFLRGHDDFNINEQRLYAYVMNLSKDWQPDWGGLLSFYDRHGNVVESFMPSFNSLSLFAVPARHFVSVVSPFAQAKRYALTGWLYPR